MMCKNKNYNIIIFFIEIKCYLYQLLDPYKA